MYIMIYAAQRVSYAHTDEAEHANVDDNDFLEGLADALKDHEESRNESAQKEVTEASGMSVIEEYKK